MRFTQRGFERSTAWMQEIETANGSGKMLWALPCVNFFSGREMPAARSIFPAAWSRAPHIRFGAETRQEFAPANAKRRKKLHGHHLRATASKPARPRSKFRCRDSR